MFLLVHSSDPRSPAKDLALKMTMPHIFQEEGTEASSANSLNSHFLGAQLCSRPRGLPSSFCLQDSSPEYVGRPEVDEKAGSPHLTIMSCQII
jgi:hypothetical protein